MPVLPIHIIAYIFEYAAQQDEPWKYSVDEKTNRMKRRVNAAYYNIPLRSVLQHKINVPPHCMQMALILGNKNAWFKSDMIEWTTCLTWPVSLITFLKNKTRTKTQYYAAYRDNTESLFFTMNAVSGYSDPSPPYSDQPYSDPSPPYSDPSPMSYFSQGTIYYPFNRYPHHPPSGRNAIHDLEMTNKRLIVRYI